jgi:hypothetical protein
VSGTKEGRSLTVAAQDGGAARDGGYQPDRPLSGPPPRGGYSVPGPVANREIGVPRRREALFALASDRCFCHKRKKVRQAFCFSCYVALPKAMRDALWLRVGAGFEQAYLAARDALTAGE